MACACEQAGKANTCGCVSKEAHDARVGELLAANNRLVEEKRALKRQVESVREIMDHIHQQMAGGR
jgi:predicted Co/Zn/Cd cation transporter (cation efflux family)